MVTLNPEQNAKIIRTFWCVRLGWQEIQALLRWAPAGIVSASPLISKTKLCFVSVSPIWRCVAVCSEQSKKIMLSGKGIVALKKSYFMPWKLRGFAHWTGVVIPWTLNGFDSSNPNCWFGPSLNSEIEVISKTATLKSCCDAPSKALTLNPKWWCDPP